MFFQCVISGWQFGDGCSKRTRYSIHPEFAISTFFTANCTVISGCIINSTKTLAEITFNFRDVFFYPCPPDQSLIKWMVYGLQVGNISEHEGKSKVFCSNSYFLFSSIRGDCIFSIINRCVKNVFPIFNFY